MWRYDYLVDGSNKGGVLLAGSHNRSTHRHHEILVSGLHHCINSALPPCRCHLARQYSTPIMQVIMPGQEAGSL
jgi:hypothetical protein